MDTGRGYTPGPHDQLVLAGLDQVEYLTLTQLSILTGKSYRALVRRMAVLHQHGLVKRIEPKLPNLPVVFMARRKRIPSGELDHQLGVSAIYVRVFRACHDLGWPLHRWLSPKELQPMLSGRSAILPDAFFQANESPRKGSFFVEYEHTTRGTSVLKHKLNRYLEILNSGKYEEAFEVRTMRVLLVYESGARVDRAASVAAEVGMNLTYFTSMERVQACSPKDLLTAPVWRTPAEPYPVPLWG